MVEVSEFEIIFINSCFLYILLLNKGEGFLEAVVFPRDQRVSRL